MYKVYLVDDDNIILEELESRVPWMENGFEVVGCCTDPVKAIEEVGSLLPDVLICDLRMPEIDTERNGHAISTILESYDEFGNLVQSVLRIEYDSVEDLQWSHIHWNRIYYPYDEYGVDEPSMEYVNPDYYESERKLNIEEYALDAACLGVYENYIYYDLMGQYWNLERYLSCFDRWMKEEELENYYSDGSSLITQEVNPLPFHSAVEIRGNIDTSIEILYSSSKI